MRDFTTEEKSLIFIAEGGSREETVNNIFDILTSPDLDADYKRIAESVVEKLDDLTDEEYAELDFDDGFDEE